MTVAAHIRYDCRTGLHPGEDVREVTLHVREVHLVEEKEVRLLGVVVRPQRELQRVGHRPRMLAIHHRRQAVLEAENCVGSGPVRTNWDHGKSIRPEPLAETDTKPGLPGP